MVVAMSVIDAHALPVASSCCSTSGKWDSQCLSSGRSRSRNSETGRPGHGHEHGHARFSRRDGNQLRFVTSLGLELRTATIARSASRNTAWSLGAETSETFATNGNTIQTTCCSATMLSPTRIGQFRVLCLRSATLDLLSHLRHSPTNQFGHTGSKKRLHDRNTTSIRALQGDFNYEREETRWLREEQRWLREEQRWRAQEARLGVENDSLRDEVAVLRKELAELRRQREGGDLVADSSLKSLASGLRSLLQALPPPAAETTAFEEKEEEEGLGEIVGIGSLPEAIATLSSVQSVESEPPLVTTSSAPEKVVAVVTSTPDGSAAVTPVQVSPSSNVPISTVLTNETLSSGRKRRTLKAGMEGDDVKELQDTLALMGYYSGEEDIEYAVFSTGTTSAVMTWQATIGVPQDGLVTEELMLSMLAESVAKVAGAADGLAKELKTERKPSKGETSEPSKSQASSNIRAVEIDRYERTDAQETAGGSLRRVYLLGENRWEEPDRIGRKQDSGKSMSNGATTAPKVETCFACRGVGTIMCTDCEGTGDLNVEEQFLEWTDEGARCPYCEGLGAIVCEICNGTSVLAKT